MKTNNKFLLFMRKYAFYFVLGFCVLAVALSVTLLLVLDTGKKNVAEKPPVITPDDPKDPDDPKEPDKPTVVEIVFAMPVNGTLVEEYNDVMAFNATLGKFTCHAAMDFAAEGGSKVYAAYDGTVEKVEKDQLKGITVTIDHGNGLKSEYNSLAEDDGVTVGQKVKKGDVIGEVSTTNLQELQTGAHLHFAVTENGKYINPLKYLAAEEK